MSPGICACSVSGLVQQTGKKQSRNAKELADQKYLSRIHFPTVSTGASPFVYSLGIRGLRYLSECDGDIDGYRPLKSENYFILKHLLSVNDFAISARLLPRVTHDVT